MALTLSGTNGVVGAGFTVDASGVSVTAGVGTFTSYQGSAANLTQIPAANIVGVCTAGLGNASGAFSQGITMADAYKVTSSFSGTSYITSNWARDTSRGGGNIGSAMSESSGVFTFPSTGVYLVYFAARGAINNASNREVIAQIYFTSNNSSYNETANCAMNQYNSGQNTHASCNVQKILDINDVSNEKVKFRVQTDDSNFSTYGSSDIAFTFVQFIRLGDT